MVKNLVSCLLQHRHISKEDQLLITAAFKLRKYKSGEWLLKADTVSGTLFFIDKGVLKITVPHPVEKDIVYYFMEEGQFMTFLYSMYGNIPAKQGLQAACDLEAHLISLEQLFQLYEKLPYLRALIDEIAQLSMAEMVTIKNLYLTGNALAKYELFLRKQPATASRVALTDIASYLGITPQSLSRIRKTRVNK
ncbi:CRP-like cAMP-binding protein [Pedobacter cryoconitis]|uniref:Crp/Fnr family transcriptional regulator n=1 Tax=Pedobacter cryoconitis TaxID=188932 RepID=UPI0016230006|nr:Crp/Fnr family transcriptional regulator [Pedobacter cryoconitis]MBB6272469.1 CRP-like cAMP-binding protein [Pedobacter cryoconitis]